jgi:tRNA A-37 threonylcarbamoyl transferase component Bud32
MDHFRCDKRASRPREKLKRIISGVAVQLELRTGLATPQTPAAEGFHHGMGRLLQISRPGQPLPRRRLREAEINRVAELCKWYGKDEWSLRPRTFIILYMIGRPELIDDFVRDRLFDVCLPYSANNLPAYLTGESRLEFLEYQENLLTKIGAKLERPGYEHQNIRGSADDLFTSHGLLGRGGSAEVDRVMGKMTGDMFARKRIRRDEFRTQDQQKLELFVNELETLKSLSHKHVVKFVASYTDSEWVGLIMLPVADMNLATFLNQSLPPQGEIDRQIRLRSYFGCIATAVDYLHSNGIRHKDIKPQNVLVTKRKVYIADFGTSYLRKENTTDTTEGTVKHFTRKYVAPETAFGVSRSQIV